MFFTFALPCLLAVLVGAWFEKTRWDRLREHLDARFDELETWFDRIDERCNQIDRKLDRIEATAEYESGKLRRWTANSALSTKNPLKWKLKLKLTAELAPGECVEYDVTAWERGEEVTLGSIGLSLAEGKTILAEVQTQMVAAQIERHGQARRCCARCGRKLPNKGHYRSTFRSVFGNVAVRVRRVTACRGCGEKPAAPLFTRRSSTAPELRYLNAKLAAPLPFGKVADFLNEVLPVGAATNAATVRNRTRRVGGRLLRDQAKPAGSARPTPSQTRRW
jgi:hypothetical protein